MQGILEIKVKGKVILQMQGILPFLISVYMDQEE